MLIQDPPSDTRCPDIVFNNTINIFIPPPEIYKYPCDQEYNFPPASLCNDCGDMYNEKLQNDCKKLINKTTSSHVQCKDHYIKLIDNIPTEQCDENENIKPSNIEGKCDDEYIKNDEESKIDCGEDNVKKLKKCENCKDDYIHSKHYIPPFINYPPLHHPIPINKCINCSKPLNIPRKKSPTKNISEDCDDILIKKRLIPYTTIWSKPCKKDIPSSPKRVKKCTDEYSKSITLKNCTNTLKICKNHLENKNCDDEYIHESEDTDCEDEQVKPKSSNDCCDYYDSKIRKSIIEYFI